MFTRQVVSSITPPTPDKVGPLEQTCYDQFPYSIHNRDTMKSEYFEILTYPSFKTLEQVNAFVSLQI